MPFYSGTVNSYTDIRSELIDACVLHGWTQNGNFLTKGNLALELRIVVSEEAELNDGEGLHLEGGTGYDGDLQEPLGASPRLGPPSTTVSQAQWPMDYSIHVFTDPDEVYLVVNHSVDYYWWLAFGQSVVELPGTGMWLAANAKMGWGQIGGSVYITPTAGAANTLPESTTGIFWRDYWGGSDDREFAVHMDFPDVPGWAPNDISFDAPGYGAIPNTLAPLLSRSPSAWNDEAVLLPIQHWVARSEDKRSLVVDLRHARVLRIDSYDPGQIITLGSDQWCVYPFYRKNADQRDGGNGVDHSGTMGWAIRYDPEE